MYEDDFEAAKSALQRAIFVVLSQGRFEEAMRLFNIGLYRGAIAASAVVLEQRLRQALMKSAPKNRRMSLKQLVEEAQRREIIDVKLAAQLNEAVLLRNHAVHEIVGPNKKQAEFVLSTIRQVIDALPEQ